MKQPATATTTNGRATKVLEAARRLFRTDFLPGDTARELGVESTADSLTFGDELNPLVRQAGRASGFGSDLIDVKIRDYLDATYGKGRWLTDRPPHPWEKGGGCPELDRLVEELDGEIAKFSKVTDDFWAARDEISKANQSSTFGGVPPAIAATLATRLQEATKAFEVQRDRTSAARAKVTTLQLRLQDAFRASQARKGK